ncbi:MAG TPA: dihydrodipicolinate synthase family protein [Chryseolinea sp.]|jgi:4-hydroxy-tetrahydrodipicolinate synthase|nr:dihydrodipicolinate synthase family protein [Chryseolinea sp.]
MDNNIKFSRKDFLKIMTATGFVASASGRGLANTSEKTGSLESNASNPIAQEKKFVPVMITPFQQNGEIDLDGVTRLIDFYLATGVKGFFANCLSSEMYQLSEEERLTLTRFVVKRVNGKVPVVATGSFGSTISEQTEFAKKIYDTGIDAVILISSHYAKKEESDAILLQNIERMLAMTGSIPMGLYECPSPYKRIISPEVFKSLLETKRMVYHKDTSIDQEKVKAKLALIKNNPLEFYDAHTANTTFSIQHGAKGMSAISGNFYPEILVWMCNHVTDPSRQDDVKWLQEELINAEDVISQAYPMSSKYFLQKRGLPILPVSRTSSKQLNAQQKEALDGVHQTFLQWCQRLKIEPVSL